jgi:ketosteroid isomerase-like protein
VSPTRALRACAGAVFVLTTGHLRAASAQSADEQAVLAANTAFYEALSARDAAALAKAYAHQDFVVNVTPNGKYRGPGWVAVEPWTALIGQIYSQLEVKPSDVHVHVNGNIGWVVVTEQISGKLANGNPVDATLQTTNIFEKIGRAWLMTQHQPTPVAK